MRVVLDTNILVRAAYRLEGPARAVLDTLEAPPHALIASVYLLHELERVLNYPRLGAHHGLDGNQVRAFVVQVEGLSELVDPGDSDFSISGDPTDDLIMQTAISGHADVLCTIDRHLHHPDVQAYSARHGIRIMTDVALLRLLRGKAPPP